MSNDGQTDRAADALAAVGVAMRYDVSEALEALELVRARRARNTTPIGSDRPEIEGAPSPSTSNAPSPSSNSDVPAPVNQPPSAASVSSGDDQTAIVPPTTLTFTAEDQALARVAAKRRIAKFYGNDVRTYKVLNEVVESFVNHEAQMVLTSYEFNRTATVQGIAIRAREITRADRASPLLVPRALINAMASSLEHQMKVAQPYYEEYNRSQDAELGRENDRHQYYRDRYMEMFQRLQRHGQVVDRVPSSSN